MTEQDIDKHFRGYKWHHILIYGPAGALFVSGLINKEPLLYISAVLIFVGGILQGGFFLKGFKMFTQFLKEGIQNNQP